MSTQDDLVSTDRGEPGSENASMNDQKHVTEIEAGDGKEVEDLPLDVVFEILSNQRRRLLLRYLDELSEETATLSDLAEHIAAIENETTSQGLTAQQRKRVYVGLYQCHLPKMASSGIVKFDKNRGTVSVGPNLDQLEPYLDVDSEEGSTERESALLGVVAIVGYGLAAFGGIAGVVGGGVVVLTSLAVVALARGRHLQV